MHNLSLLDFYVNDYRIVIDYLLNSSEDYYY